MQKIKKDFSLKGLNTFGVEAKSKFFSSFSTYNELKELLKFKKEKKLPLLVLGAGSNILFTSDFEGITLKNELKGKRLISEDQNFYYVQSYAGENWHSFVEFCIENNYAGIENLSLIPGTVGAAPIQNIGAYGVELKDVFYSLEAINSETLEIENFYLNDCKFGYRNSVFKNEKKNKYIILSLTLKLNKVAKINTSYGQIEDELNKMKIKKPTIKDISKAIINIRKNKLPDPEKIGNAGSFFKNPIIDEKLFNKILKKYPKIPFFKIGKNKIKIPAAWLIEECGWKGKQVNNCGVYKKHALVIVNYGGATGKEILNLSENIKKDVMIKFGIKLEREVKVI